jgi:hypothetical protein
VQADSIGCVRPVRRVTSVVFAIGALLLARDALSIVMRHDVAEQRFLDLAKRYPAAVLVRPANGSSGEGTLVAPRWVLTAAHVGSSIRPGDVVVAGGKSYPVERVFIHPEWKEIANVAVDIALVRLKFDVLDIEPAILFNGREIPGSVVTFVGRGASGTGLAGVRREDLRLRAATNRIDKVEGADIQFRFDAPDDAAVTELEGISGPGDSGGAAYLEQDGKLFVVGVSSWQDTRPSGRVQGLYGVVEHYVRVSHHYDWITRTIRSSP